MTFHSLTLPPLISVSSDEQLWLPSNLEFKQKLPMTDALVCQVEDNRNTIRAILSGEDERLLVIVGPC